MCPREGGLTCIIIIIIIIILLLLLSTDLMLALTYRLGLTHPEDEEELVMIITGSAVDRVNPSLTYK